MSLASEARDGADRRPRRAPAAELLDALLANSDEAIVVVGDDATIRYVSPGAGLLLGYDPESAVGDSVFSYLHPEDVEAAAHLFAQRLDYDGADLGHEIRLRTASGSWLPTVTTGTLVPDAELGAVAITITAIEETDAVQRSLRRRVVVEEYCNRLGAGFLAAQTTDDLRERLETSLGEIGLLTGADAVSVFVERRERGVLERLGRWVAPALVSDVGEGAPAVAQLAFGEAGASLLETGCHWDDLATAPSDPVVDLLRQLGVFSILTSPFSTGSQRGVLVLTRFVPGPAWSDADAQLARKVAELCGRALHTAQSEELLALTYRQGPLAISIRTWDGALVDCNDQYLELFGLTADEAAETPLRELVHVEDRDLVADASRQLYLGEVTRVVRHVRVLHADGRELWLRTTAVSLPAPGSSEPFILCALEDVTASYEQRSELEHAARHDSLTGVANRPAMIETLDAVIASSAAPPALLVIDVDRFKLINDSMGHVAGDRVLCAVADRLRTQVRADDLVARLGGDEFAVVVPAMPAAPAIELAERMRRAMERPVLVDGRSVAISISVGVAVSEPGVTSTELMLKADRALYAAKAKGRNRCLAFDESMHDEVVARLDLERELRHAIDRDELEVHFQPEFSLPDCRILGAEALLRWSHPARGLVPADEFIEVAEHSGIIDELGRFALREACRSFAALCAELDDDHLMLRVNISAREFARPELPDLVRSAVADAELDPARLCLEMTETTLMDSPDVALETFARLHDIGVEFAIDDFGTGYSSLTYLKRFPVDALKIDRGFVTDLETDGDSQAIVESILSLANALSLEVVAEGIETRAQLQQLTALGCDRGQGYIVAGALSATDLVELVRSQHA